MALFFRLLIFCFRLSYVTSDNVKLLKVKRLKPDAILPCKATKDSAGLDLCANEDVTLLAKKRTIVGTSLAVEMPSNTYGRIAGRSGLAFHYGIFCFNGILDPDYMSEIKLLMTNESNVDFPIKKGDRVAQLIVQSFEANIEVREVNELKKKSERGERGFGSSGMKPFKK